MLFALASLLLALSPTVGAGTAAPPRDRLLVSPAWLQARLGDRDLVILEMGDRAGYEKEHIPGARYLEYRALNHRTPEGISLQLPPIAQLDSLFSALGVTPSSRIVLYFGTDWVSPLTRAWLTLKYMGLAERTAILDGGLPAWKAEGYPVTADAPPTPTTAPMRSTPHPEVVVDAGLVESQLGSAGFRVIDARDRVYYHGLDNGSGTRPGHLPGAVNIPYTSVIDSAGRFLPDSALRRIFRAAGVNRGDRLVAYCHIGQQATAVVFAAQLAGFDAKLYDGSYQEWSRQDGRAVEGAIPPTRGALLSPAELAERMERDSLTIIDVRSDLSAYLANHIPGAVYLHYETLRASRSGIPADLLSDEVYAGIFSQLGVRRDRPVVVYASGDQANFNATFVAWLLAGFHHPEVYLLDGGYDRWSAEARQLTRVYPAVTEAGYPGDLVRHDQIRGLHVQHSLGEEGVVIVDVRPPDQFAGEAGAQIRRGRIPGAVNHPWSSDLETRGRGRVWKSVEALRASYEAQGITPEKTVILYCNTGTEASHAYFALRFLLGYQRVLVYTPSWTEWSAQGEWPIEGAPSVQAAAPEPASGKSCADD